MCKKGDFLLLSKLGVGAEFDMKAERKQEECTERERERCCFGEAVYRHA